MLPAKAVLLTFDDGYRSFYTRAFPVLELYDYPAVLALVGSWLEVPAGATVQYGDSERRPREDFVSWDEIRKMVRSGRVEVASHSYALHRGLLGNANGNTQPAATTREYDAGRNAYESDRDYIARIRDDLKRNNDLIEREVGVRPLAVAWPFGSYNDSLVKVAADLGMPITLTLDEGLNGHEQPIGKLRRVLIENNPGVLDFLYSIRATTTVGRQRMARIALDDLYHPDPQEREERLSRTLDALQTLAPTTVVLRAYSTEAEKFSVYFPNRSVPVRADMLNRTAWQIQTRLRMQVIVELPPHIPALQPQQVQALYADLAKHAHFSGLFFDGASTAAPWRDVHTLTAAAKQFRAPLRSYFALPAEALAPEATTPTNLLEAVRNHDYLVVMLEPRTTLRNLGSYVSQASALARGLERVVFDIGDGRSVDGRQSIAGTRDPTQLKALHALGAFNVSYRTFELTRIAAQRPNPSPDPSVFSATR
jgi:peptidoglycan/xylan/chitin deacetylase (PgdA/CDA1 family)